MLRHSIIIFLFLSLISLLAFPPIVPAEFFKYKDETGKTFYVDDVSKIPPEYRNQIKSYEEDKDYLTPAQKMAIEEQKEREQTRRQWRREQLLDQQRRKYDQQQQAQTQAAKDGKAPAKNSRGSTNVFIANGQVVVPVQFRHKGKRVTASLLLDTGANKTLISQEIGDQLGIEDGVIVGIQVVGGAVIPGMHVEVEEMTVGPNKKRGMNVIVLKETGVAGHDGLLGMDFLMGLKFHVDYDKQRIVWSG